MLISFPTQASALQDCLTLHRICNSKSQFVILREHNQLLDYILECNSTQGKKSIKQLWQKVSKKALLWGKAVFNILILKSHFSIFCFIMNYSQLLPINTDKMAVQLFNICSTNWMINYSNEWFSPASSRKSLGRCSSPRQNTMWSNRDQIQIELWIAKRKSL